MPSDLAGTGAAVTPVRGPRSCGYRVKTSRRFDVLTGRGRDVKTSNAKKTYATPVQWVYRRAGRFDAGRFGTERFAERFMGVIASSTAASSAGSGALA